MKTIHVVIADGSLLVRMALKNIINQAGYSVIIRSVSDSEKFKQVLNKEQIDFMIAGKVFLNHCNSNILRVFLNKSAHFRFVLINDDHNLSDLVYQTDDAIDFNDNERTIIRKIEKQISEISKAKKISSETDEISTRERDVLRLVALGMTNKEIAEKLFISTHTVITHRKNITAKLGIKTIAGLTIYALLNKIISADEIN